MKKRFYVTIAMSLAMIMGLTGCGSRTKATDVTVDDGDTIVVSDEDIITEDTETETDVEVEDNEIVDTEVIGNDTEAADEFVGAEDENIVLYAEIGKYPERAVDIFDYVEQPGTINATENIPVYNVEGIEVGYIKAGASIFVSEGAEVGGIARFENPITDADYDYLYVLKDFVTDANEIRLTAETMKQRIIDDVLNSPVNDDVHYDFLNEKASDMEVYECNLQSVYTDELDLQYWIDEELTRDFNMLDYKTLYVECEEDVDGWITVRLYYKDAIDWTQIQ